ncbi:type I-E CRISPR-associated protein Cas7/Cse4/CasC [Corynebacterium sp. HMSC056E09]|uniref:type I-E CRISPR-associated protein Cas7/Cse4/CasC n=1 Tax=unclassified Corynebacterium TaxID=2624378 RepID=UPI0008A18038|nr:MULTISPECIES: type I-E CRISPR-associated protein Cas7/Cse4/CasC [unclassified Corynebacterium]OFL59943.1 type I-E CRISPR-associated protein Cas7/Cse4/CasC [Corynebacterium sp. HMSC065D07]OFM28432.1 type I-E CRISPR-associated protein Cas7/Cse4/CasC [Corynebacterium sp. HMSC072A02]OFN15721.1 type I-E CRISPR-associated protein Cas7/Cse4/CasC [Corynebacterium sp. HMSC055A01]OFP71688.1 type I-E CRISPR-associated protein Cas7/Cse4/CasC [Corynebacterium sp. HMSC078C09]OFQ95060.1 type I-E CRISPR-as
MSLVIDIHALQTLPPSLINRDDTGAPKSAIFGGVPRQRVSSQSWKRAIRNYFEKNVDPEFVGDRSKRLPEKIAKLVENHDGWDSKRAIKQVSDLFKAAGISTEVDSKRIKELEKSDAEDKEELIKEASYPRTKYLIFLSPQQIDRAVRAIVDADGEKIKKAEAKEILDTQHSVDMAMFGRMIADDAAFNVDAAVQVAHALGIHSSAPEFDYFTAVDDLAEDGEETGAGMIGTVQMMSSTLYRFATVNVAGLTKNLDSEENAKQAAVQFVDAFIKSMPTGKINSFANHTLPELVYVTVRDTRPVSLVTAFEEPVQATDDKNLRLAGAEALAKEEREFEENYGLKPLAAFAVGVSVARAPFADIAETVTLPELADRLAAALNSSQS